MPDGYTKSVPIASGSDLRAEAVRMSSGAWRICLQRDGLVRWSMSTWPSAPAAADAYWSHELKGLDYATTEELEVREAEEAEERADRTDCPYSEAEIARSQARLAAILGED